MGPLRIDAVFSSTPVVWSEFRLGEIRDRRSIVEADIEERDCHGSLCGPQSFTLRVGMPVPGRASAFSPMIGGLGAVIGAAAMNLKPGPRPEAAPGPSLDGWAAAPKGLEPAGPPFALLPLISINDREGGLRFLVNW